MSWKSVGNKDGGVAQVMLDPVPVLVVVEK